MIRVLAFTSCALGALLLSGCATLVGDSTEIVQITTAPPGATLSIADENGKEVWRGTSPAAASLKLGDGYFDGQTFMVTATLAGYQSATVTLDTQICMWYLIGNLGFGGILGYFVIDPLTGAMWDLPDTMPVIQMTRDSGSSEQDDSD